MITVTFHCGGCDNTAKGTSHIRQEFKGLSGRGHGFGSYHEERASTKAPDGWVAFDSIGATYCPKCADELWPDAEAGEAGS